MERRAALHVADFGQWIPCLACRCLQHELDNPPYRTAGAAPTTPFTRWAALLREAGAALGAPSEHPPAGDIVAVHDDPAAWERLGLTLPPHRRPLFLGRDRPAALAGDGLTAAAWQAPRGMDADRVRRDLVVRWRPPLTEPPDPA